MLGLERHVLGTSCFPNGQDNADVWRNEYDLVTCGLESDEDSGFQLRLRLSSKDLVQLLSQSLNPPLM
ncbi:unnamed protein product [Brassica oleracea]